jgi:hypothetical protein
MGVWMEPKLLLMAVPAFSFGMVLHEGHLSVLGAALKLLENLYGPVSVFLFLMGEGLKSNPV